MHKASAFKAKIPWTESLELSIVSLPRKVSRSFPLRRVYIYKPCSIANYLHRSRPILDILTRGTRGPGVLLFKSHVCTFELMFITWNNNTACFHGPRRSPNKPARLLSLFSFKKKSSEFFLFSFVADVILLRSSDLLYKLFVVRARLGCIARNDMRFLFIFCWCCY